MSREPADAGDRDESEFEVSDPRSSTGDATSSSSWAALFEAERLAHLRRRRLVGALITGLLALAVIVSAFASVRGGLSGVLGPRSLTPALAFPPGEDLFYLLPNPPGVSVTLDGHALTRLPAPGDPRPLRLSPGRHVFAWISHLYPFMPQTCIVFVSLSTSDTCPFLSQRDLPFSVAGLEGRAIALHDSLATLAPAQGAQLTQAIRSALAAARSQSAVQPGEPFNFYPPGPGGLLDSAPQPLSARLSFQLAPQQNDFEPCIAIQPAIPCRFPGQDCTQLCTVAQPPAAVTGARDDWIAAAMVSATTDFATPDGRTVVSDNGIAFGPQLIVLRITWDGARWYVTPIFGHTPGLPVTDDIACNPARLWLASNATWSFMLTDPPPGVQIQFVSDANPADGCVAVLDQAPGKDTPAVFLERFGVLLAVNDVAAGSQSDLPRADAAEQRLARQIAAQAGISVGG